MFTALPGVPIKTPNGLKLICVGPCRDALWPANIKILLQKIVIYVFERFEGLPIIV